MARTSLFSLVVFGMAIAGHASATEEDLGRAYFAEQVYPLLKEHCFKCHGAGKELKGNLRLTSREGLRHGGELGAAFNADDPASSLLLEMVSYKDDEHQMPPKGKLPEEALLTLAHWLEMGAPYDPDLEIKGEARARQGFTVTDDDRQWWAFQPIANAAAPQVSDALWNENGIDAFIKAQLDREGLVPNPEAAPEVLIRRLHYDLIGLPPTPSEVATFVEASAEDAELAWSKLVDELLARPQYGEKWARHWLDLVRYAESNGFERDNEKPEIWRYRDYVIDAFNDNLPYDQFIIEQLAGDEIAQPTKRSLIATGYHRLMQWDDEPADREQHVYDVLADNVQVTSETFFGLTLGCARCHDHKVDPISQKDYYSFMAIFKGVAHYRSEGTIVHWATEEERAAFEQKREEELARLEKRRGVLSEKLRVALDRVGLLGAGDVQARTLLKDAREGGAEWFYTTTAPSEDWHEVGFVNKSWYQGKGGFGKGRVPGSIEKTEWGTPEIWMRTTFGLTNLPETLVLEIHHDEDVEVYLNGVLIHQAKGFRTKYETILLPKKAVDALQTGRNVVAVHCRQTSGGQYIDLSLKTGLGKGGSLDSFLAGPELKKHAEAIRKAEGRDLVAEYKQVNDEIMNWRKAEAGTPINAVTELGTTPSPMHVHLRGSAHVLGDEVQPALPAIFAKDGSAPPRISAQPIEREGHASSGRRLQLAKWLIAPENPLTARVMVNRIWQYHFGRGIAPSTSDFGKLGEAPTHPELLDWLATQFRENAWDLRAMHRLILLSRTYRLSSEPESGNLQKDPRNLHFWRYDMRRLTAEELRDSVLAVSGNLELRSHGPWVYPPLPAEVLSTASRPEAVWPLSEDPADHFRRSLYVHVKRNLRHPLLMDFDQADTDTGCPVRFATTVPTQALSLLNSEFINEQAGILAARMRASGGDLRAQISEGLALVLQRPARNDELDDLITFYTKLCREVGLSEERALDRVALLALNLNEFLYLD